MLERTAPQVPMDTLGALSENGSENGRPENVVRAPPTPGRATPLRPRRGAVAMEDDCKNRPERARPPDVVDALR